MSRNKSSSANPHAPGSSQSKAPTAASAKVGAPGKNNDEYSNSSTPHSPPTVMSDKTTTAASPSSAMASLSLDSRQKSSNSQNKSLDLVPADEVYESEEEVPQLSFFDEKYATCSSLGEAGNGVQVRVNRLLITPRGILDNLLVTAGPLRYVVNPNLLLPVRGDRHTNKRLAQFQFANQTAANTLLNAAAILKEVRILNRADLADYINGRTAGNFNYGHFTQALNIMVRHFAAQNTIRVGKNRIFDTNPGGNLPSGLKWHYGFANSVRPGRLKRIGGFGESARLQTFNQGGRTVTVQHHFDTNVLQRPLQFPELPVVNVGSRLQPTWIPMELPWVEPGQYHRGKVPDEDMRVPQGLPQFARMAPPLRNVRHIQEHGGQLLQLTNLEQHNILKVAPTMTLVNGRVLQLPHLQCSQALNGTGSEPLQHLVVLVVGQQNAALAPSDLLRFEQELKRLRMNCRPGTSTVRYANTASDTQLDAAYGQSTAKTVLVVMDGQPNTYAAIKRWGDIHAGINRICSRRVNVAKMGNDLGFQANLALKFNAKLGGKNFILADTFLKLHLHAGDRMTMMVGADVVHPGGASVEYCPSIAAVVASTNGECFNFPGSVRPQAGRKEDITDMYDMMLERLTHWYHNKANKKTLPDRILFYRDGVSENQFATVKQNELAAIERASKEAGRVFGKPDYKPLNTAVVCTKRHQTRFFPATDDKTVFENRNGHFDRNENFKPGLVVDDPRVRLPNHFDFFLQSHMPLQGTGRPCHYFVLENQMNLSPDDLQRITYGLSWIYATSLTPVSLVTPAYYADKLCQRARCWLLHYFVGRHPNRDQAVNFVAGTSGLQNPNMTDDQKRTAVANRLATGGSPDWPRNAINPCNPAVQGTMFYV
ncbi:argonaute 7 [Lecanosticta acicola]|uniref:Argonaute 7 n=1 Tax=Lecanosticta acicola TaxID=111012 RepID=A0AAI8YRK0_9PEZI|nr:argonaute 7 [Lecanosticta acicola]